MSRKTKPVEPFRNLKNWGLYINIPKSKSRALTLLLEEPFRNLNYSSSYINTRKSKSKPRAVTLLLEETLYLKNMLQL